MRALGGHSANEKVPVRFHLWEPKEFGKQVLLLGGLAELGGWQVARARELRWHESHWVAAVELEPGSHFEFKLAVKRSGSELQWQEGANRKASVPARGTQGMDVNLPQWTSAAQTDVVH